MSRKNFLKIDTGAVYRTIEQRFAQDAPIGLFDKPEFKAAFKDYIQVCFQTQRADLTEVVLNLEDSMARDKQLEASAKRVMVEACHHISQYGGTLKGNAAKAEFLCVPWLKEVIGICTAKNDRTQDIDLSPN